MYLTPNSPPNIRGGLKTDSKCSNTIVYAPLLNRFSPCS